MRGVGWLVWLLVAVLVACSGHEQAPLDLWQLALPWMTLLLASAGDVYSALSGHELDLFMSSLTAALAVLLTVNMIIERREFLEMLTEIEASRRTLSRGFRSSLASIQHLSTSLHNAEHLELEEVRHLAAEIIRTTDGLHRTVDEMVTADPSDSTPPEARVSEPAEDAIVAPLLI